MKTKTKTRTAKLFEILEVERWTKDILATKTSMKQIEDCQITLSIIGSYIGALRYCLGEEIKEER
jgi:hypothetical protein